MDYTLKHGSHASPEAGMCAMEWVAYLANEPHSDSPVCVSPVLGAFARSFNDGVNDEVRQRLRPYLARMIGTAGDGRDEERAWLCTDWLVRVCAPAFMDLTPSLRDHAAVLRGLPPVLNAENATRVMDDWDAAWDAARNAAWDAARNAARDAAWASAGAAAGGAAWAAAGAAARDAAWAAAGAAAGGAAWAAVGAAVGAAAWASAGAAAGGAAWAAAGAAAGDAAWDAARNAAWAAAWDAARAAARDAARASAGDALAPTVAALQGSAFDLLDQMLPTETVTLPESAAATYERLLGVAS